jgi:hypothetical protein
MAKFIGSSRVGLCALAFATLAAPVVMLGDLRAGDSPCIYDSTPHPCEVLVDDATKCSDVNPQPGPPSNCGGAVQYVVQSGRWKCQQISDPALIAKCFPAVDQGDPALAPCLLRYECKVSITGMSCEKGQSTVETNRVAYEGPVCGRNPQ